MSAPQIPNLASLRRGKLKPRGLGSGTQEDWTPDQTSQKQHKDDIIRNTDNDAATSRLSAVEAGYLDDPFAKFLSTGEKVSRRLPLMNRGTYVRTTAIDRVVKTFVSSAEEAKPGSRVQIISLGAGSDTRFFQLRRQWPELRERLNYHELDFPANAKAKIDKLRSPAFSKAAKDLCDLDLSSDRFEVLDEGARLRSDVYCIHPIDLRSLAPVSEPLPGLDLSLPTLLISECCLVYLSPDDASDVLIYFTKIFARAIPLAIVIYEPIRPHDAFGRTMASNLTARGIVLQTVEKYNDLPEQKQRLRDVGFDRSPNGQDAVGRDGQGGYDGGARAADIDFIWNHWIDEGEKERIEKLEWMDEVEEFVLLGQHYCVSWGWRGFGRDGDQFWSGLKAPGNV